MTGFCRHVGQVEPKLNDYNSKPTEVTEVFGDSQSTFLSNCSLQTAAALGLELKEQSQLLKFLNFIVSKFILQTRLKFENKIAVSCKNIYTVYIFLSIYQYLCIEL